MYRVVHNTLYLYALSIHSIYNDYVYTLYAVFKEGGRRSIPSRMTAGQLGNWAYLPTLYYVYFTILRSVRM